MVFVLGRHAPRPSRTTVPAAPAAPAPEDPASGGAPSNPFGVPSGPSSPVGGPPGLQAPAEQPAATIDNGPPPASFGGAAGGMFGGGGVPQTPPGTQPQPYGSNPFSSGGLQRRQFDNFSGHQVNQRAQLQPGNIGSLRQRLFGNPFNG